MDASPTQEHVKAGRLRPLAVTTAARLDVLPDVPPVGDFVPGYEASGFAGIGAPRNTPAEIIDMLNKELNAILQMPEVQTMAKNDGSVITGGTPEDFHARLKTDLAKFAKLVKAAGIKAGQ